jgi:hypothetical protein
MPTLSPSEGLEEPEWQANVDHQPERRGLRFGSVHRRHAGARARPTNVRPRQTAMNTVVPRCPPSRVTTAAPHDERIVLLAHGDSGSSQVFERLRSTHVVRRLGL